MQPETILAGLKHLSSIHRGQFDERRKYEWKVLLSTLSFYVLPAFAKFSNNIKLPEGQIFKSAIWIFFLFLAIAAINYLRKFHKANDENKSRAQKAEEAIAKLINFELDTESKTDKMKQWSLLWQSTIIL